MCLIAFALQVHPDWPLVVFANRDESWDRPTQAQHDWQTPAGTWVRGGRDTVAGGTWMAFAPHSGRFAWVTNVRHGQERARPRSRGALCLAWLDGEDLAHWSPTHPAHTYGGCNLILGQWQAGRVSATWLTNCDDHAQVQTTWRIAPVTSGIHTLSNAALDTPWPKSTQLRQALADALPRIKGTPAEAIEKWNQCAQLALTDRRRAAPDTLPQTHIPCAAEHALSSVFVDRPDARYGTRTSTLWLGARHNTVGLLQYEQTHVAW